MRLESQNSSFSCPCVIGVCLFSSVSGLPFLHKSCHSLSPVLCWNNLQKRSRNNSSYKTIITLHLNTEKYKRLPVRFDVRPLTTLKSSFSPRRSFKPQHPNIIYIYNVNFSLIFFFFTKYYQRLIKSYKD